MTFTTKWHEVEDNAWTDEQIADASYETFASQGHSVELNEDGKYVWTAPTGEQQVSSHKDESKARKAFTPRYFYDLSACFKLFPHPNTGAYSWTLVAAPNEHWSAYITFRGTNRRILAYAPTPELAVLKLYWKYKHGEKS